MGVLRPRVVKDPTLMAHGRKRILGGKMLVVVGVVLAGAVVWTKHNHALYGETKLTVRLRRGMVEFKYFEPRNPFPMGFLSGPYENNAPGLIWWLDSADYGHASGVFAWGSFTFASFYKGTEFSVLLWPLAFLVSVTGASSWRMGLVARRRRWKNADKACHACGYSKKGLAESAPCPECGRAQPAR